jgi:hypothetical protein
MSDYDQLSIRILSGLTGELLPDTSWHVPEGNEQRIAIAVCEATGMTPERWDRLSKDERIPWLHQTLKALEKLPAPNAWLEGDDLPSHRPELARGESVEIDTTPTLPQPPRGLVESAAQKIPEILANVPPKQDGVIELIASHLAKRLQDAKHSLAAAHWAIHEAVQAGRLRAGTVEVELASFGRQVGRRAMYGLPDTRRMEWTGGGKSTIAIPGGKPAPFDAFKVTATESLWTWWRSFDASSSPADQSSEDADRFIERVLAGPDGVELTPHELTLLEAHLRQPVSFVTLQQEKKATGHSPTEVARNKLEGIRDFNRGLRQAKNPPPDVPLDPSTMAAGQGMLAHIDSLAASNTVVRQMVVHMGARHAGGASPRPGVTVTGKVRTPGNNPSEAALAVGQAQATGAPTPGDDASLVLMRVFTNGITDDRIKKAARLLSDAKLTANEKLTEIDALIRFPATASAEQLGEMLGVTKQAVLKTDWWMQNRKGEKESEVGRRREGHRKRAKSYESPGQNDYDG